MRAHSDDGFWDVRDREVVEVQKLNQAIDGAERAINLADRIQAIEHAPGFAEFVKAIEDIRAYTQRMLVGCEGRDQELRQLQGRCQALNDMLAILRRSKNSRGHLAARLTGLQNALEVARKRQPKTQPEGKR